LRIERDSYTIKKDKMKKAYLLLILSSTLVLNGYGQNVDDALRYSQVFYGGTARFRAMGGAFTALGGDLSAISLNPAGIGVFRSFEVSLTPQMYYNNNSSVWNGSSSSDFKYNLNLNQFGIVTTLIPSNDKFSLNLAYTYNRTNNFNENITINGISNNSSMADYWVSKAEGTYFRDLRGAAGIAYDAWLIDTISNAGASSYATAFSGYGTSTNATYGQTIKRVITNEGYTGEHAISIGGNLFNKLFFGLSLGMNRLNYTGHYQHIESDYNNVISDFKNFTYTDHFVASGTGYSGKLGVIYKPVEFVRVGLAVHTPVFYRITEKFYDNIATAFDNNNKYEFANDKLEYKYSLMTPWRINLGAAFKIKKFALLSADYEFVDYRIAKFSQASDSYDYSAENDGIKSILKSTSNLRFGAEFRINSIYLRGGYSHYGKAFNSNEDNKDLAYNGFSCGIGMRQQNFYFDIGGTLLSGTSKYYMYNDPPYLEAATIKTSRTSFAATIGFKF
jgi:hypothetical protein